MPREYSSPNLNNWIVWDVLNFLSVSAITIMAIITIYHHHHDILTTMVTTSTIATGSSLNTRRIFRYVQVTLKGIRG